MSAAGTAEEHLNFGNMSSHPCDSGPLAASSGRPGPNVSRGQRADPAQVRYRDMTPPHFRRAARRHIAEAAAVSAIRSTLEDRTKPTAEVALDLQLEARLYGNEEPSLSRWSRIQALMPASREALNRQVWET